MSDAKKTDITPNNETQNNKNVPTIEIDLSKMDDANLKAMHVLTTEGQEAFIKQVFTGENEKQLTYSEMRSLYG